MAKGEKNKMPNVFQKAINFSKALWKHISKGMKLVSRTTYVKRLKFIHMCFLINGFSSHQM